ncbi:MAG TPA: CDP-alcohol phosphatidyltransferase family protein [Micromonosporaceae bacterium]
MRSSGRIARRVLQVRVVRRRPRPASGATAVVRPTGYTTDVGRRDLTRRMDLPRPGVPTADTAGSIASVGSVAPVSPAIPAPAGTGPTGPITIPLLPGDRTTARRCKFAVVQACTLAGLALGVLAIFLAMRGEVRFAAICLIAYAAFDGIDGALARRLGVCSPFGAQMDSLVDMSSTGIAAPVVMYASLAGTVPAAAAAVAAAFVAGGAAIRLARFNVSPKDGRFFCGVPTTVAAAMLAFAVLLGLPLPGFVILAGATVLAFAMVSSFPYAKLARLVTLPPWLWLLPFVGALIDVRLTFALAVVAYLLSGPLLWLRLRRTA